MRIKFCVRRNHTSKQLAISLHQKMSSPPTRRRRKVTRNTRDKTVTTIEDLRDAVTVAVARKRQEDRAWIRQRFFFAEAQRRIEEAIWAAARNGQTEVRLATFNNYGTVINSVWSGLPSPVPYKSSVVQKIYARRCNADLETMYENDTLLQLFTEMLHNEHVTRIDGVRYDWRCDGVTAQKNVLEARWY